MKSLGMIRPIDKNGRIVIPMELRKQLGMKNNEDCFEIFTDDNSIILRKHQPSCIFCGESEEILPFNGYMICLDCIDKLTNKKNAL